MRKTYLLFRVSILLLFVVCQHSIALGGRILPSILRPPSLQQTTITGRVTDENGEAFPGVNVVVKGTNIGTVTSADGAYSLDVSSDAATLVFSFVGYAQEEVAIEGRTTINIALTPDVTSLNEIVVTALGVQKESKRLGYSATTVQPDYMITNRTTNMMESLEGKVAGLNITPPAAGAGSSTQIRLRGQAAFAGGNNSPLFVINGLPLDQAAAGANGNGQVEQRDRGDNLQNINPDDIESMTVLKGATAAAIYGARAANGAIIITTKSGSKNQGIGVDFTSSYTTSHAVNFMDEIVQTKYGAGQAGVRFATQGAVQGAGQWGWGEKLDGVPTVNFDGVMRPYSAHPYQLFDFLQAGTNFTNTVALSGGGAKGSFRASFSNTDATGIQPSNEYKKRIFNVGINQNITSKLKLQLNINYANEENINPPQVGTQGEGAVNFFNRMPINTPIEAYRENAINPATGAENKTNGFLGTINNPYYQLQKKQFFTDDKNRLLGTATLRYQLTDWLYAQGRYNYDRGANFMEWNVLNGAGATTLLNADGTFRGRYDIRQIESTDINADFLIGGNKDFGKFSVDASFGGNTWRRNSSTNQQYARNFVVQDLYSIKNGTIFGVTDPDNTAYQPYSINESRINSLYGWAEFGYNELLYLNVTGREDWFSVLNPADNSKFYPSVSGSFIFSELLPGQTWLTYGKLRSSWAEVGSVNAVNPYEGVLTYSINPPFNGQVLAGINGTGAPNPSLVPFTINEKELGLEMRMFNNKVLLDVAVFDKVTTDQILDVAISNASGYNTTKQNKASLKNSGVELLIEATPFEANDFKWTTSWNNTYLKTEVLDVGNESGTILLIYFNGTTAPANGNEFLGELRYTEGLAMNQLYTRTYLRNEEGEILVTPTGRLRPSVGGPIGTGYFPIGSSIPKYTGGWTNTFSYKNLTLGVFIDYKFGGMVMSSTLLNMTRQGHSKMSLEGRENGLIIDGVYDNGEPNTSVIPVASLQGHYSDYRNLQIGDPFVFKSDFVKLRTISLSYNFKSVIRKVEKLNFVKGLTLSAACRNVAILYKDLPGLDPESVQSSGDFRAGYEGSALPTTRSYNLTLNVKF